MDQQQAAAWAEAARRGILTPQQMEAYQELARRGLIPNDNPGFSLDAETGKDILKALPGAAAKGVAGAIGAPYDIADLAAKGIGWIGDKAADYISPGSHPFADMQEAKKKYDAEPSGIIPKLPSPSYENIKGGMEKLNDGPFYEAKTPVGKIVTGGVEAAPSALAFGGRDLPAALFKGFTSGAASEAAGQAAEGAGLGDKGQAVARVAGAFAGPGGVAGLRRGVTPFPVTDPVYQQAVRTMDQYGLPMTAARRTGSPALSSAEANLERYAPRSATPEAEKEAFTAALMRNAGSPASNPRLPAVSPTANNALHEQRNNLNSQLDNWFKANAATWNPRTFEPQLRQFDTTYRNIAGSTAGNNVRDITDEIVYGLAGKPPAPNTRSVVAGMTGQRYQYIKDRLEKAIDAAGSPAEQNALMNIKQTLENQLHSSVSPAASEELGNLNKQWANYKTLESSKIPPTGIMEPTDVKQRSKVQSNLGQGSENAKMAQSASRVYTPKENLSTLAPGGESLAGGLLGPVASWLMGHGDPGTAATAGIYGAMMGYGAKQAAKHNPVTGKLYHSPLAQGYLANQKWMPSPGTMADPALVAKVLAASPNKENLLPAPQE